MEKYGAIILIMETFFNSTTQCKIGNGNKVVNIAANKLYQSILQYTSSQKMLVNA